MAEICFEVCPFAADCKDKVLKLTGEVALLQLAHTGAVRSRVAGLDVPDPLQELREKRSEMYNAKFGFESVQDCPGPNRTIELGSRAVSYVCRNPSQI